MSSLTRLLFKSFQPPIRDSKIDAFNGVKISGEDKNSILLTRDELV